MWQYGQHKTAHRQRWLALEEIVAVVGLLASDPAVLALELQVANKRMVCSASYQASTLSQTLGCQIAELYCVVDVRGAR